MSEMHYIAKFAEKQLADAKEKGMCSECLAALLNALYAEADALTPGGGFVVAHVAKELDLLEELPNEKEPGYASVDALARDLSRAQRPLREDAGAAHEPQPEQAGERSEPALPPINVYQINGRNGCAVIVSASGDFWYAAGKERQEMLLQAVHERTGNLVLAVVDSECAAAKANAMTLDNTLTVMMAVSDGASLDAATRAHHRAEGVCTLLREIEINLSCDPVSVGKVRAVAAKLLDVQECA
ncbi:hypothetical protein [Aeromonas enteropelogenes]|uniref:hypothetical protein n=1 Tax=Aeromonas enteropelogenes TaxID=29489 RepID=UPI003B9F3F1A